MIDLRVLSFVIAETETNSSVDGGAASGPSSYFEQWRGIIAIGSMIRFFCEW